MREGACKRRRSAGREQNRVEVWKKEESRYRDEKKIERKREEDRGLGKMRRGGEKEEGKEGEDEIGGKQKRLGDI